MKMKELYEANDVNPNLRSVNLTNPNLRPGDIEAGPAKKKYAADNGGARKAKLNHLRSKVAALKRFGDSGDFWSIDAKELLRADSRTVLVVSDNKKTYPEKSYVKIGTSWISLADGSVVSASKIIAQGKKLGDKFGWAEGTIKL